MKTTKKTSVSQGNAQITQRKLRVVNSLLSVIDEYASSTSSQSKSKKKGKEEFTQLLSECGIVKVSEKTTKPYDKTLFDYLCSNENFVDLLNSHDLSSVHTDDDNAEIFQRTISKLLTTNSNKSPIKPPISNSDTDSPESKPADELDVKSENEGQPTNDPEKEKHAKKKQEKENHKKELTKYNELYPFLAKPSIEWSGQNNGVWLELSDMQAGIYYLEEQYLQISKNIAPHLEQLKTASEQNKATSPNSTPTSPHDKLIERLNYCLDKIDYHFPVISRRRFPHIVNQVGDTVESAERIEEIIVEVNQCLNGAEKDNVSDDYILVRQKYLENFMEHHRIINWTPHKAYEKYRGHIPIEHSLNFNVDDEILISDTENVIKGKSFLKKIHLLPVSAAHFDGSYVIKGNPENHELELYLGKIKYLIDTGPPGIYLNAANMGNYHWVTLLFCKHDDRNISILIFDSIYPSKSKLETFVRIKTIFGADNLFPQAKFQPVDVIQQFNGSDCGITTLQNHEDIINGFFNDKPVVVMSGKNIAINSDNLTINYKEWLEAPREMAKLCHNIRNKWHNRFRDLFEIYTPSFQNGGKLLRTDKDCDYAHSNRQIDGYSFLYLHAENEYMFQRYLLEDIAYYYNRNLDAYKVELYDSFKQYITSSEDSDFKVTCLFDKLRPIFKPCAAFNIWLDHFVDTTLLDNASKTTAMLTVIHHLELPHNKIKSSEENGNNSLNNGHTLFSTEKSQDTVQFMPKLWLEKVLKIEPLQGLLKNIQFRVAYNNTLTDNEKNNIQSQISSEYIPILDELVTANESDRKVEDIDNVSFQLQKINLLLKKIMNEYIKQHNLTLDLYGKSTPLLDLLTISLLEFYDIKDKNMSAEKLVEISKQCLNVVNHDSYKEYFSDATKGTNESETEIEANPGVKVEAGIGVS